MKEKSKSNNLTIYLFNCILISKYKNTCVGVKKPLLKNLVLKEKEEKNNCFIA